MAAPELQRLALEAKSAAAILKYLPVTSALLPEVVETLKSVSAHPLWPARAAALVFVQVSFRFLSKTASISCSEAQWGTFKGPILSVARLGRFPALKLHNFITPYHIVLALPCNPCILPAKDASFLTSPWVHCRNWAHVYPMQALMGRA